jgi:hypothetical protein
VSECVHACLAIYSHMRASIQDLGVIEDLSVRG